MLKFDKERGFPVQVGVILGLRISVYRFREHVYDVKVNHRLQFL